MSPSEGATELSGLCGKLKEQVDRLIEDGRVAELDDAELRQLISSAVRLYAARNEGLEQEIAPLDANVATTDAVVMASALLKAHDLNPFDLALWFSRSRIGG
jgi:hypothetical protein